VDSWCNAIGSAGIAVILAFCNSQEELVKSDEEHVEFAKYFLNELRFLYKDADGDNKLVCHKLIALIVIGLSNGPQK